MPLLRYFWFLCAAVMLLNVVLWRRQLAQLVSRGVISAAEAERFARGAALGLGVPCVALGIIALVAGWSDPFCAGVLAFDSPARIATSLVVLATWAALLWWVWVGNGAELLGRIGPALSRPPRYGRQYSPATVRLVVTALVLFSAVGAAVVWRRMPTGAPIGCVLTRTPG